VKDPCTIANGNSWVAKTLTNIATGVLVPVTQDISIKDTASVNYGNLDGFTLCGARTYSLSVTQNSVAVSQTFISLTTTSRTGDTLSVSPTA
jgi:hypothetical protein